MIKSIIIDDEKNSRDLLEKMISRYLPDKLKVVSKIGSITESINAINNNTPDLVFLDVHLDDKSGLELLYHYKDSKAFDVIFVTGYKDYAIDALRYDAVDYILKPVNRTDLVAAVDRYEKKKLNSNSIDNDNMSLIEPKRDAIPFKSKNGFKVEQLSSIVYCEAKGNYTEVNLNNKSKIKVSKTLKKVEEMINHLDFFRIHKSFYLNMNFITSYNKSENLVELNTGMFLPVSVRKNESFIKKLISRN